MQPIAKRSLRNRTKSRLFAASVPVVEQVEKRIFMSTTIANWSFDSLSVASNILSPAPDAGSVGGATALSIGMQSSSSNANSPGGVYAYPNANADGSADVSDILNGTGNQAPKTSDNSSTGQTAPGNAAGTNPAWRVRGGNGWSSAAAIGSQGAQFTASTAGDSNITFSFDLDPSSGSAPSAIAVEYNTNVSNASGWTDLPASAYSLANYHNSDNSATDGMSIQSNTTATNPNLVNGGYFQVANPTTTGNNDPLFWQNGLSVSLVGISGVNNDPNFGMRIVNAATGTADLNVSGAQYPATASSGNWRLDNVNISYTPAGNVAPTIAAGTYPTGGNPANQTVAAGQPVSFTAASTGANPPAAVQWYEGTPGSGTAINDTANPTGSATTLTFTTDAASGDNGNTYYAVFTNVAGNATTTAATLSDPQAAVAPGTSPSNASVTAGNPASFTATATGSPAPTVLWQESSDPTFATGVTNLSGQITTTNASGLVSSTYTIASPTTAQTNTYYRAVFTNTANGNTTSVDSGDAKLTVSGVSIADWNFTSVVAAPDNTPAATSTAPGITATAQTLGMTNTYAYAGTTATNSVAAADITNGVAPEDFWRVRGAYVATGTAPNIGNPSNYKNVNGWNLNAPQYSQGVQFNVSTVGYSNIQASFDWESTGQGVKDLQEQYSLDTTQGNSTVWTNIGSVLVQPNGGASLLGNAIDLSSISGAANDANFGLRFVSVYDPNGAADGLTQVTDANGTHYPYAGSSGGAYNNSSGNWGFDNIQVTGQQIPEPPAIAAGTYPAGGNPANATVTAGSPASFTAAATGFPTPTVQWEQELPGSGNFTNISGATSTTYTIPATTAAMNGTQYEAVFTNTTAPYTATTTPATLTVNSLSVTAPAAATTDYVSAGNSITLTSTATSNPTPTVQWEFSTPAGNYTNWQNVTPASGSISGSATYGNNVSGSTSPYTSTYTFTPTVGSTGDEYEAFWSNAVPLSASSQPTTVVVTGSPFIKWTFPNSINSNQSLTATSQPSGENNLFDSYGLTNILSGAQATTSLDEPPVTSSVNTHFSENVVRIRATGTGGGGTQVVGWDNNAPEYSQGVEFNVNTSGYSNVTLNFDWAQTGIGDIQPQYLDSNGNWINIGPVIQSNGSDYYGITPTTTPTGVTVNLQGIAAANNNPSFVMRLAAAYSPLLPSVVDGNSLNNGLTTSTGDNVQGNGGANVGGNGLQSVQGTLHGQYANAGAPGAVDAQQTIQIPDVATTGNLTFNGQTTGTITFDPNNVANTIAAMQTALQGLSTIGANNVQVSETIDDQTGTLYTIEFTGNMAHAAEPLVTTSLYSDLVAPGVQTSGNFTLTVHDSGGNYTTAPIAYNASTGTVLSALQAAVPAGDNPSGFVVNIAHGGGNYTDYAVNLNSDTNLVSITGDGTNLGTPGNLQVRSPIQNWQIGANGNTSTGVKVYGDSGSWEFSNISLSGENATGGPTPGTVPLTQTIPSGLPTTLTASAYSETPVTSVQWKVNEGSATGNMFVPVSTVFSSVSSASQGSSGSATYGNNLSGTGPTYNSSFTFTPPTAAQGTAYQYEAVFSTSTLSGTAGPATETVVAPTLPTVTSPANTSVEAGNIAIFKTSETGGSPVPTIQWQMYTPATGWQNLSNGVQADGAFVSGAVATSATSSTLDYTTNKTGSEDQDLFRAVYTNGGTVDSGNATLTVLKPQTLITDWNFANATNSGDAAYTDSPAPNIGNGTASIVGMTFYPYTVPSTGAPDPADNPGAPYIGQPSFADGDVTNAASAANPNFTENLFRPRGGVAVNYNITGESMTNGVVTLTLSTTGEPSAITPGSPLVVQGLNTQVYNSVTGPSGNPTPFTVSTITNNASGNATMSVTYVDPNASSGQTIAPDTQTGTLTAAPSDSRDGVLGQGYPANGWDAFAPNDSQGVQFSASTEGYNHIYVTMDWYSTTSGILDGQPQYTTDGVHWTNLGGLVQATSNDYNGASAGDTTGAITGIQVQNNVATVFVTNDFTVGNQVSMANTGGAFNGTFTITAANSSSFSFGLAHADMSLQAPASPTATATEGGLPIPLTFDVSNIAAAANNPNFGVRLVSAYNPTLVARGNSAASYYALASSTETSPVAYPGQKGNWRFGNVQIHGVPDWLATSSQATYVPSQATTTAGSLSATATTVTLATGAGLTMPATPFTAIIGTGANAEVVTVTNVTQDLLTITRGANGSTASAWPSGTTFTADPTLNVSGAATIIADPQTAPTVAINGNLGNIPVSPDIVGTTAAAQTLIQPLTNNTDVHIGGVDLAGGAGIDMASVLGVGQGGLNGSNRAQGTNNVLVLGQVDQNTAPTFSVDSQSNLNLEDNDMIVHGGNDGSSDYASVLAAAALGRNPTSGVQGNFDGQWNGNGLSSSAAANFDASQGNTEAIALAVVNNADLNNTFGQFSNWTVGGAAEPLRADGNDVIVKYTYVGDINFDGKVTGDDVNTIYNLYDNGASTNNSWAYGSFFYDGLLTSTDIATVSNTTFDLGTGGANLDPL